MKLQKLRLFVAVETPEAIKGNMLEVQRMLQQANADVKWEAAGKLHATLKFLGETAEATIPAIVGSLESICRLHEPMTVRYAAIGCFPRRGDPRVIWIGMDDPESGVSRIQKALESAMLQFGFEKETRPFHPHVTLGRVKSPRNLDLLLGTLESVTFESRQVAIPEIVLVKSDLTPRGSVYSTLNKFRLTA